MHFERASGRVQVRVVLLAFLICSCGSGDVSSSDSDRTTASRGPATCEPDLVQILSPDPGAVREQYLCYGFALDALGAAAIKGILWRPPLGGGVIWHHATLSAVLGDFPDGPFACTGMPANAVSLHVWTPGGDDLVLPDGAALALPAGTARLALEMHVVRVANEVAQSGSVALCGMHGAISNVAGFLGVAAPVPAIRPHSTETSVARCTFQVATHLWSVWPHMHLVGSAIEATLRRVNGRETTINRVDPWDFHAQRTYPLSIDVEAGDQLITQCWWKNPTSDYVFPGLTTGNEMCNHGFIGWPAPAAQCEPAGP